MTLTLNDPSPCKGVEAITITPLCQYSAIFNDNFQIINVTFFLIFAQNLDCGYPGAFCF